MKFPWSHIFIIVACVVTMIVWRQGFLRHEKKSTTVPNKNISLLAQNYSKKPKGPTAPVVVPPRPPIIPLTPSPLDKASSAELRSFPGAIVVEAMEIEGPEAGQKTRLRILKTNFKYPFIRTEESVDSATGAVINRQEMVADHLLVTLPEGEDPQLFLKDFGSQESSIVRVTPDDSLYQLILTSSSLEALPQALEKIKKIKGVLAEPNFITHALFSCNDPGYFRQWGFWKDLGGIDAYEGWMIENAAPSIVVALIDSGIRYTHEDLAANIWCNPSPSEANDLHGWNAISNNGDPMDQDGHGTHCAGIIGAVGNNGRGITGVAWKVQLMACKALDQNGSGTEDEAIQCIDYAIRHGAKILNCSLTLGSIYSKNVFAVLHRARAAGVIIVAAAGNGGHNNDQLPNYPASYQLDNIVSVASSSWFDELDSDSNYGATTVHLAAPGVWIYSTWKDSDSSYAYDSGTSMAAPFVTGTLALLEERYPNESYQTLIAHLLATTDKFPSLQGQVISGGRLNLHRALAEAL